MLAWALVAIVVGLALSWVNPVLLGIFEGFVLVIILVVIAYD